MSISSAITQVNTEDRSSPFQALWNQVKAHLTRPHDGDLARLQQEFPNSVIASVSVHAVSSLDPLMGMPVNLSTEGKILRLLEQVPWNSIDKLQAAHDFTTPQSEGEAVVLLKRTYYSLSDVLDLLHSFVENGSAELILSATRASCTLINQAFSNDREPVDLESAEIWLRRNYDSYPEPDRDEQVQHALNGRRADNKLINAFKRSLDFDALFEKSVKTLSLSVEKGVDPENINGFLDMGELHGKEWRSRIKEALNPT